MSGNKRGSWKHCVWRGSHSTPWRSSHSAWWRTDEDQLSLIAEAVPGVDRPMWACLSFQSALWTSFFPHGGQIFSHVPTCARVHQECPTQLSLEFARLVAKPLPAFSPPMPNGYTETHLRGCAFHLAPRVLAVLMPYVSAQAALRGQLRGKGGWGEEWGGAWARPAGLPRRHRGAVTLWNGISYY